MRAFDQFRSEMSKVNFRSHLAPGAFSHLLRLFAPILLITFSNFLFLIVEKLLLARLSIKSMEAAVNTAYACQIFQGSCVSLVMMAQVFVGRWHGGKELTSIGPGIWQFIWFSFLSMVLTVPLSLLYGRYYFYGTDIEQMALPYFYFLIAINFLYPLTAALSCFYLGQGKTKLILFTTLASQLLKLALAIVLIFGIEGWIPRFELMGGAFSTFIAQVVFCLILFFVFINNDHSKIYHSRSWAFRPFLFWECIHPGMLRAFSKVIGFLCWASIAHLMTAKGGDYLLILSIGGTLFLFLPFLAEAICQAQTTVVSQLLGAKHYHQFRSAFYAGMLLVGITTGLLAIPLLLFPIPTFEYLFPTITLQAGVIKQVFLGIWCSIAFFTVCYIPISVVLAFKDTKFSLFIGILNWINGYLLIYLALTDWEMQAKQFWLVLALMHGSNAIGYFWRMRWLQSKLTIAKPVPEILPQSSQSRL